MKSDITFEGVSFNVAYNAGLTEKEFTDNGTRDGLYSNYEAAARQKLMKDAYAAIKVAAAPASK